MILSAFHFIGTYIKIKLIKIRSYHQDHSVVRKGPEYNKPVNSELLHKKGVFR